MNKNTISILIFFFGALLSSCQQNQVPKEHQSKESIVKETNSSNSVSKTLSEEQINFTGTWTGPDFYPIINIKIEKDGKFIIKEVYGLDSNTGIIYQAFYNNVKLEAVGNKKDFYKWTLPTFKFIDENNDKIEFNSGIGPIELIKTDKEMPSIKYSAPKNND